MIKSQDKREAERVQNRKAELGLADGIELKETDSGLQMKEDLGEPRS